MGSSNTQAKLDAFQLNAMELQSLQSQLKTAIQNHQIVLSKMRIDPQNSALQRQLHDLQAEIMTLSDKQKQVVQQLRTELERKQNSAVLKLSHNAQFLPRAMLGGVPVKLQAALKGGSGGVLLPQVVVVPSCSSGSPSPTMAPHQGPSPLPTLLAPPPIRVPQYPPPCGGQRLAPQQQQQQPALHPHQHPQQKQHTVATPTSVPPRIPKPCVAVLVQASSVNSNPSRLVVPSLGSNIHSSGGNSSSISSGGVATMACAAAGATTATTTVVAPAPVPTAAVVPPRRATPAPPSAPAPPPNKEDHLKLELLGALGLMTREALRELQHRRGERKRRTTANPHFSNAALEEKRRNALLLITGDNNAATAAKGRHKGRARLDSSTPSSPEGSSSENTPNGHPSPPPPLPPPPQPPTPCCDVVIKKEEAPPMVNGDVFRDWTRCAIKEVTSSAALGWVSDYALLKSAKAEEKQKLLKRSLELKAERMQLEEKKQQLSEIIANQQKRRVELQHALQTVQTSLEKFEHVVKLFKEPS